MKHIEMIIDYITDGTDFQYNDNHGVLVRCKDCKHRKEYNGQYHRCSVFERTVKNDDYCSFGEQGEA